MEYMVEFDRIGGNSSIPPQAFAACSADQLAAEIYRFTLGYLGSRDVDVIADLEQGNGVITAGFRPAGAFTIQALTEGTRALTKNDPWAEARPDSQFLIGPDTDWETVIAAMCATRVARQPGTTLYSHQQFAVKRLDPALRAAANGHTVEWDPPAGLTSLEARWTCTHRDCGAALLIGRDRRMRGTALQPCSHMRR